MSARAAPEPKEDFSLFLGGPLYQLLLRVGLIKPPLDRLKWRLLAVVAVAWAGRPAPIKSRRGAGAWG